jgi:hypothetical protein
MNQPHPSAVPVADRPLQIVSGKITLLHKAEGRLNLLAGLQQKAGLAGAGLALAGQAGAAANALSLVLYDGEDVEHFGFALGEQVVVGTFENAFFDDGDEVKVVASRLNNGILFAHAIVRVADSALWMPYNIKHGRVAMMKSTAKMGGVGGALMSAIALVMFYSQAGLAVLLELLPGLALGVFGFIALVGSWVYLDSRHEALYAERLFKAMGFKNPSIVNLSPFSLSSECGHSASRLHYVFNLRKALAAYGSLSKAPRPAAKVKTPRPKP